MKSKREKLSWVNCPICGETDMRREEDPDGEGMGYIYCVNLNCGSNGGTNFDAINPPPNRSEVEKALETIRRALQEGNQIEYQTTKP